MREQVVSTKAVVTVSEMARMVGLSRARFYELVEAGVFPTPVYDVTIGHHESEMTSDNYLNLSVTDWDGRSWIGGGPSDEEGKHDWKSLGF